MPKSAPRRKRIRAARTELDPTNKPQAAGSEGSNKTPIASNKQQSKQDKANGKGEKASGSDLLPIFQKLQSTTLTEKLWATSAISHILANADSNIRRSLQGKNVVGLLIQNLDASAATASSASNDQEAVDASIEIMVEACGGLRNLAIEAGHEVCAEMFNKSVVQALSKHLEPLNQVLNNILQGSETSNTQEITIRKHLWNWLENIATLFWCLAETSDKTFKAIVSLPALSSLLYTILRHAVPSDAADQSTKRKIPLNVALAAAQAVYVLTDANVPSAPKFPLPRDTSLSAAYANTKSMLMEMLRSYQESQEATIKVHGENAKMFFVLVIGILQNLSQQHLPGRKQDANIEEVQEFNQLALSILTADLTSTDLQKDSLEALAAFQSLPPVSAASASVVATAVQAHAPARARLESIEKTWTRLRLSLEIIGEISAELDGIVDSGLLGVEEYEEWNGISSSNKEVDGMEEDDNDATTTTANQSVAQQRPNELSTEALDIFSSLPNILITLAKPTSISFAPHSALAPSNSASKGETLISTQVATPTAATSSSNGALYVPNMTELVSLVHSRALECLNNLLITISRSESEAVIPEVTEEASEEVPDEDMDALEDLENIADKNEEIEDTEIENLADETLNGSTTRGVLQTYIFNNLDKLQNVWESLFQLLVAYITTLQAEKSAISAAQSDASQGKKKTTTSSTSGNEYESPIELCIQAALGCVWALGRFAVNDLTIGKDEAALLLQILEARKSGTIDSDIAVRCIGALGALASRKDVSVEENKIIGTAIVSTLSPLTAPAQGNTPAQVAELVDVYSQVLDTIFDVYADEERTYDRPSFIDGGFLNLLSSISPNYKKLVKSVDRRKYPESRDRADAALANLLEFIKYRKTLQ